MREILFRGKTENGEWVEGYLIKGVRTYIATKEAIENMVVSISGRAGLELIEVIPDTVGQFTGLTDKNGKNIFEGDIIKVVSPNGDEENPFVTEFFAIVYEEKMRRFVMRSDLWNDDFDYSQDDIKEYKVEVIGNIHDNPEFLES